MVPRTNPISCEPSSRFLVIFVAVIAVAAVAAGESGEQDSDEANNAGFVGVHGLRLNPDFRGCRRASEQPR